MKRFGALVALMLTLLGSSCGGGGSTAGNPNTSIEDTSISGAAAAAIGGALNGSAGSTALEVSGRTPDESKTTKLLRETLNFMPNAQAATLCPTTLTANGLGCSDNGSDSLWLTFDNCTYGDGTTTFTGLLEVISSRPVSCGTLPFPGVNGSLIRQYVKTTAPTMPAGIFIKSAFGTTAYVDDATLNLGNFNGTAISTIANGGYGAEVDFGPGGGRSGITIAHRLLITPLTNMSIAGHLGITESVGAKTRTVSGQTTIYENLLKVVATSTFTNVVQQDGCCVPVSGVISTTFARGSIDPSSDGSKTLGGTETLTLTGCGTGSLVEYNGTTENVTLSRCF